MEFSIIIPTLNEANSIISCLSTLQALRDRCEIIAVDGGSIDHTTGLAKLLADKLIQSEQGRAVQMNAGAKIAAGDVLIFPPCRYLPTRQRPKPNKPSHRQ